LIANLIGIFWRLLSTYMFGSPCTNLFVTLRPSAPAHLQFHSQITLYFF
jgi:hypothetical protein